VDDAGYVPAELVLRKNVLHRGLHQRLLLNCTRQNRIPAFELRGSSCHEAVLHACLLQLRHLFPALLPVLSNGSVWSGSGDVGEKKVRKTVQPPDYDLIISL